MNPLLQILENYRLHGEEQSKLHQSIKMDYAKWHGFVNGVNVCIEEVKRTQSWEKLLGKMRVEVVRLMGEPDEMGGKSRKYRTPSIYKYGDIEVYFQGWKRGECYMVFDSKEHQVICGGK